MGTVWSGLICHCNRSFFILLLLAWPIGCGQSPDLLPASEGVDESNAAQEGTQAGSEHIARSAVFVAAQATDRPTNSSPEPSEEQTREWQRPAHDPLQLLACRESPSSAFVAAMDCTSDGRHVVQAGLQVAMWSVDPDIPEHIFLTPVTDRQYTCLAVAPNGEWFAVGDNEGSVRVWSIDDQNELASKQIKSGSISDIAISPNSTELSVIGHDNKVLVCTSESLDEKIQFEVDTNNLSSIEYVTSQTLAAAGETTTIWNVGSGNAEQTISGGRYNYSLARSVDNQLLAYGEDDVLKIWDVGSKEPRGRLPGEVTTSELVAFSPDGGQLATANGSVVRIFDVEKNRLLQVLDCFGPPIVGLNWLPESNLLVVASENSRTRIWGDSAAALVTQLKPLHQPLPVPDGSVPQPAAPNQLERLIDLRTFPRIAGGKSRSSTAFSLSDSVTVGPAEALSFYRYQLSGEGWSEQSPSAPTSGSAEFSKDGIRVSVSCYEEAPGRSSVNVSCLGNHSLVTVPKSDASPTEVVFENTDVVMYRTTADIVRIETNLLRQLNAAGWTAFSRLQSSHNEQPDARTLEFLKDGLILTVSISSIPGEPGKFNLQYSQALTTRTIPVPADPGYVEFDDSTQPLLVAVTSMNREETTHFYDKQMGLQGWIIREFGRSQHDEQTRLSYVWGQREVTVVLVDVPDVGTLVRVGDDLDTASWQLAAMAEAASSATPVTVGLEATDFPMLNDATAVEFDADGQTLDFVMRDVALADLGSQYTKEMTSRGWQQDGAGITSDEYVFLTFKKGKVEIAVRARLRDGQANVNVQGDGLLWNKPLPGGKKIASYESWLRRNKHRATLDRLDAYIAEMDAIERPAVSE